MRPLVEMITLIQRVPGALRVATGALLATEKQNAGLREESGVIDLCKRAGYRREARRRAANAAAPVASSSSEAGSGTGVAVVSAACWPG
jgi:hypothetical protein